MPLITPPRNYHWLARDPLQRLHRGQLQASHPRQARAELRRRGLYPIRVRPAPNFGRRLPARTLAHFSRQLAILLDAGLPILPALTRIAAGETKPRLQGLWQALREAIGTGLPFYRALQQQGAAFDPLYYQLIRVGEHAGQLAEVLQALATYRSRQAAMQARLRQALSYPTLLSLASSAVLALLLGFVVPAFQQSFAAAAMPLPRPTQWVLALAAAIRHDGWMPFAAGLILILTSRMLLRRWPQRAYPLQRWRLHLPLLGRLRQAAATARIGYSLSLALKAGIPLLEALSLAAETSGEPVFQRALLQAREELATGHSLEAGLRKSGLFAPLTLQLVAVGEASGTLTRLLEEAAAHEEEALRNRLELLAPLLEPILMVILAILIGGVLIALYLPIFQLASLF